ncbi:tRNA pseudouridine(55) synthase [Phytophthora cinnamomi]|uniref:tRNA pseudouridine(55) synthase n=1 Tax=Phytophthora cinnamomi TaxID=4785 RepID=UPI00355A7CDE|nr:tRNA pseudouridine(55) synthase [Phytophthora cinnamomi]
MGGGFLNVRKPAGLTSHGCVGMARRVFDTRQVGHGGTLDPMATGVLTLAVGRATRFLQYLTTGKEYRGVVRLGVTTDSDDVTGEVLTQRPAPWVSEEEVQATLQRFIGDIEQVPPRVSAIKKDGVRLYKLARAKKDFEVKARRVHIDRIDIQTFVSGDFPEADIHVVCGGGTYIRSIARECGEALLIPPEHVDTSCELRNPAGEYCVGGTLTALERTRSGAFSIDDSLDFAHVQAKVEGGESPLRSIESMLQHLPFVEMPRQTAQHWLNGGAVTIPWSDVEFGQLKRYKLTNGEPIRIYCSSSPELLGIAQVDPQGQHNQLVLRKRLFI